MNTISHFCPQFLQIGPVKTLRREFFTTSDTFHIVLYLVIFYKTFSVALTSWVSHTARWLPLSQPLCSSNGETLDSCLLNGLTPSYLSDLNKTYIPPHASGCQKGSCLSPHLVYMSDMFQIRYVISTLHPIPGNTAKGTTPKLSK